MDKLKKDSSAVWFYTGCPNVDTLVDTFNYLKPNLEHITYWRGSDITVNIDNVSDKSKPSSKPGPQRKLSLLEEFALVLMRLKVGLFLNNRADRFGI